MDIAYEILNKPNYFYCERLHCRLRIEVCVGRQKANKQPRKPFDPVPYPDCEGCEQGLKNIQPTMENVGRRGKPRRGRGYRYLSCPLYADCLEIVAKKNWKTFHCNKCDQYPGNKTVTEKIENKRMCSKCKDNFTISPTNDLCASCMARLSNKSRLSNKAVKAKLKAPAKSNRKANSKGKGKAEKSSHVSLRNSIQINFGKHTSVLDEIQNLAEEEMRPLEWQIIYMLKNHLKGIGGHTIK